MTAPLIARITLSKDLPICGMRVNSAFRQQNRASRCVASVLQSRYAIISRNCTKHGREGARSAAQRKLGAAWDTRTSFFDASLRALPQTIRRRRADAVQDAPRLLAGL